MLADATKLKKSLGDLKGEESKAQKIAADQLNKESLPARPWVT